MAKQLSQLSEEELEAEHHRRMAAVDEARAASREVQHERDRRAGAVPSGTGKIVGAKGIKSEEAVGKQN